MGIFLGRLSSPSSGRPDPIAPLATSVTEMSFSCSFEICAARLAIASRFTPPAGLQTTLVPTLTTTRLALQSISFLRDVEGIDPSAKAVRAQDLEKDYRKMTSVAMQPSATAGRRPNRLQSISTLRRVAP